MSKLLNKSLRVFGFYALVVLSCSIPVYYYFVDSIWKEELDERNEILCNQLAAGLNALSTDQELKNAILNYNNLQLFSEVHPKIDTGQKNNRVYDIQREVKDDVQVEIENFRGLSKTAFLQGAPYTITVETNIEEAEDTIIAISMVTLAFTLLLIGGLIFLNRRLSRRVWLPFYRTLKQLKSFNINRPKNIELEATDIEEFAALNNTLATLISNSVAEFEHQKEFSQNASHELQTPLALAKSRIDLLVQDSGLTAEQRANLEQLNNSLSRITRINKNLLLLSKLENQDLQKEKVNIDEVLDRTLSLFHEHIEQRGLLVTSEINRLSIPASESLAEVLFSNLLSNAIRHNVDQGKINIELQNGLLRIASSGSQSLNRDLLFKRFASPGPAQGSSGLGLAIVREICLKHGWTIDYFFEADLHTFTITF